MIAVVIILLFVCIGLPLFYAWRIWRLDEPVRLTWLLVVMDACVFVTLVMLVGRWDIAGYYVRLVLLGLFAAAIIASFLRHRRRPWSPPKGMNFWRTHLGPVVSLAVFGAALIYVVAGRSPPAGAQDLAFPLRDGQFTIGQGGGITLLNYHASHRAQRFAADISAIGRNGFRAPGILPSGLGRYEIFGKEVVSPCSGIVRAAVDGFADLAPPMSDRENAAGNHVIIACKGLRIELAHLQAGSVAVEPGDRIEVGGVIGRVGNSGNSTEPHLHIHAVNAQTGEGVPISFAGRFPVRNRIYVN